MYGTNYRRGTFRGVRNGRLLVNIVNGTRARDIEFNEDFVRRAEPEEPEGHFLDSDQEELTDEDEAPAPPPRAAARPRAQAQAAPVVRPPPPPTGPGGIAFEIHNAFDNFKIDEFMAIINSAIGRNSNFKNREAPLQPLIDNIKANASLNAGKKRELTQKINRILEIQKLDAQATTEEEARIQLQEQTLELSNRQKIINEARLKQIDLEKKKEELEKSYDAKKGFIEMMILEHQRYTLGLYEKKDQETFIDWSVKAVLRVAIKQGFFYCLFIFGVFLMHF